MIRQQLIDFTEYTSSDVVIKWLAIWVITLIVASSFNKYSNRGYPSGWCFFSINIPVVLSCILFLFPYKRKIAVGAVLAQIITYIIAVTYIIWYVNGVEVSEQTRMLFLKLHMITAKSFLMLSVVDSMLHTDGQTRQPRDSKISRYFKYRGW